MNQNDWLKEMERVKQTGIDLSRDEDLSIGLMNLVSLEEHFYFSAMKTNKKKYLEMMNAVRQLRKTLLGKIVKNPEGEEWCISKHLLASSMRLYEVGTKEYSKGDKKGAYKFFTAAFDLYSLFFSINNKMVENEVNTAFSNGTVSSEELLDEELPAQRNVMFAKVSSVVKKIVDCCKEW